MTARERTDQRCRDVVSAAERMARIAAALTEAALKNVWVREYIDHPDPDWPGGWTEERVRNNPPVRVEFDHATVVGGVGESLSAARLRKAGETAGAVSSWRWKPSFGELIGVLPLEEETPVGEFNILYIYKGSSPYNRRVEQRKYLKKRLGTGHRQAVTEAMYWSKRDFLAKLAPHVAARIQARLKLDPGRFWRVARGKEFVEQVTPTKTPEMFEAGDRIRPARPKRVRKALPVIPTPSLFPTTPEE